ncbi:unnamed protein product [Durusdinium trenchii]|uniref:Uncharacterized protein n=1 Tax=Durusdinium trenchii TaxID=1381693 RepID=A0ABP0NKU5_9DINO
MAADRAMFVLSDELKRIQELQRRSLSGLHQVEAHQAVLQTTIDKLFQRLSQGQVAFDTDEGGACTVNEAILDAKDSGNEVKEPLQTEVPAPIPSEATVPTLQDGAFNKLRDGIAAGEHRSLHRDVLGTLETEGILDASGWKDMGLRLRMKMLRCFVVDSVPEKEELARQGVVFIQPDLGFSRNEETLQPK